jgi:hypothetical protein
MGSDLDRSTIAGEDNNAQKDIAARRGRDHIAAKAAPPQFGEP